MKGRGRRENSCWDISVKRGLDQFLSHVKVGKKVCLNNLHSYVGWLLLLLHIDLCVCLWKQVKKKPFHFQSYCYLHVATQSVVQTRLIYKKKKNILAFLTNLPPSWGNRPSSIWGNVNYNKNHCRILWVGVKSRNTKHYPLLTSEHSLFKLMSTDMQSWALEVEKNSTHLRPAKYNTFVT